tara:strand:- start:206 stop:1309 length:1104 start_codon:yes stop_codon:yes gene_type:complete
MPYCRINTILLCFALSVSLHLRAQNPVSYQAEAEYGFLFLHSQDVAPIGQSYPSAFGLSVQRWLLAEKHWENCFCYPRLGLSLAIHDFDNPEVLGYGLPVYGFLEPWFKIGGRWYFNLRASVGLIYLSKPYDALENPLNYSYSLPLSAYLVLGLGTAYQFNDHWRVSVQARYNHSSNGGVREPNKGLNYPTAALGLDYSIAPIRPQAKAKKAFDPLNRKKLLSLHGILAAKAGGMVGEGVDEREVTYLVSGAALRYSHQFSRSSALILETEWISNLAFRKQIERQGGNQSHQQWGLELGHEFLLGKFTFSQAAGFYLFKEYGAAAPWYQRYTLLYRPLPGLALGPGLKAHANVAEFLDFRIVYELRL